MNKRDCNVKGCAAPIVAMGMCPGHYAMMPIGELEAFNEAWQNWLRHRGYKPSVQAAQVLHRAWALAEWMSHRAP